MNSKHKTEVKSCSRCKVEKPLEEFNFKNVKKNIRKPECRKCQCECQAKYRKENKQQIKERDIVYRARKKEDKKFQSSAISKNNTGRWDLASDSAEMQRRLRAQGFKCPIFGIPLESVASSVPDTEWVTVGGVYGELVRGFLSEEGYKVLSLFGFDEIVIKSAYLQVGKTDGALCLKNINREPLTKENVSSEIIQYLAFSQGYSCCISKVEGELFPAFAPPTGRLLGLVSGDVLEALNILEFNHETLSSMIKYLDEFSEDIRVCTSLNGVPSDRFKLAVR
jgi:hypothetical protein